MKRVLSVLLAVLTCLYASAAWADANADDAKMRAIGSLTEVYGYLSEEAEAFQFTVTQSDSVCRVAFSPPDHSQWEYVLEFNTQDGSTISATTPFYADGYSLYPGENSVRGAMHKAVEQGWFSQWNAASMEALQQEMDKEGIARTGVLAADAANGLPDAAEAISDYFVSCYGESANWSVAVWQWRDEETAKIGLTPLSTEATLSAMRPQAASGQAANKRYQITQFGDSAPAALLQVLADPHLQGWTLLGGALRLTVASHAPDNGNYGLAAFARGDERLLVMLQQPANGSEWRVLPVGQKALLAGRTVSINCDSANGMFMLQYPVSAQEGEMFRVRLVAGSLQNSLICQLVDYRHVNTETGESTVIDYGDAPKSTAKQWYHVTTSNADGVTDAVYPVLAPSELSYIDVNRFPTTAQACAAATGFTLPEGYGMALGVHMRAQTSSRSADLGIYQRGVLVKVLGKLPGDPNPWYQVSVGRVQGYMSSLYVAYGDQRALGEVFSGAVPLPVAKTVHATSLKQGTGLFDSTVQDLPAGVAMHVMATCNDWLHVMVPTGELGWLMDVNGVDGYVHASDVVQAPTTAQLDWLP